MLRRQKLEGWMRVDEKHFHPSDEMEHATVPADDDDDAVADVVAGAVADAEVA